MSKCYKETYLFLAIYTIAHIGILFNSGLFWDDWTLFNTDPNIINQTFHQTGLPVLATYHNFMLPHAGVLGYRVIVFLAFLVSGLLLNQVLKTLPLQAYSRIFIVLFFMVFPVNSARVAIINSIYAICYVLFFLGFWQTSVFLHNNSVISRIIALVMFLCSFLTGSLLVYYALVIFYIIYFNRKNLLSRKKIITCLLKYIDFIILPVVFWGVKNAYYLPYGFAEGYNQVSLKSLLLAFAPTKLISAFNLSFVEPIFQSYFIIWLIAFVGTIGIMFLLKNKGIKTDEKNNTGVLIIGVLAFILAIVPYLAVVTGRPEDKMPSIYGWFSRHQLLVPLGASFILHVITNHYNKYIRLFLHSFLILLFLLVNLQTYKEYQIDWFKQQAILQNFLHENNVNEALRAGDTFIVQDKAMHLNAKRRKLRPLYEYQGLLKLAFKDENKLILNQEDYELYSNYASFLPYITKYKHLFNLKNYQVSQPQYTITIYEGPLSLSVVTMLELWYYENFNRDIFNSKVANIVRIEVKKNEVVH